jgi:hypothetical protein
MNEDKDVHAIYSKSFTVDFTIVDPNAATFSATTSTEIST